MLSGLREPIVVIIFLIGFFTAISGKPLDGVLMLLVAAGLAWDAAKQAGVRGRAADDSGTGAEASPVAEMPVPDAPRGRVAGQVERARRPALVIAAGLAAGVLYAVVVGSFTRYSWPATAGVVLVGAAVVTIGWRGPLRQRPLSGRLTRSGAALWGALLVAGGLWELAALLQQPSLTVSSYAHPTISALTDPLLATHAGRSVALAIWLALGWFLVER